MCESVSSEFERIELYGELELSRVNPVTSCYHPRASSLPLSPVFPSLSHVDFSLSKRERKKERRRERENWMVEDLKETDANNNNTSPFLFQKGLQVVKHVFSITLFWKKEERKKKEEERKEKIEKWNGTGCKIYFSI